MQAPPPYIPFVEYVLKALEHPPFMFVSKLVACAAALFLTRESPELLHQICFKWAKRFAADRALLIANIQKKAPYVQSTNSVPDGAAIVSSCSSCITKVSESPCCSESGVEQMRCGDEETTVEHLLSLLNTLVPMYFSWNWHRADYVIHINKEYDEFVRNAILPDCIKLDACEGVDDAVRTPWLLSPHFYVASPKAQLGFYSPASTGLAFPKTQGIEMTLSEAGEDNAESTMKYSNGGSNSPRKAGIPRNGNSSDYLPVLCGTPTAGAGQKVNDLGSSGALLATSLRLSSPTDKGTANIAAGKVATPMAMQHFSSSCAGQLPVFAPSSVSRMTLLTLSNFIDTVQQNKKGLVIIFHAKYSAKSTEAIELFDIILTKKLLNPTPTIAVVYAVAEPELSSVYGIGWFPTIIYVPPSSLPRPLRKPKDTAKMECLSSPRRVAVDNGTHQHRRPKKEKKKKERGGTDTRKLSSVDNMMADPLMTTATMVPLHARASSRHDSITTPVAPVDPLQLSISQRSMSIPLTPNQLTPTEMLFGISLNGKLEAANGTCDASDGALPLGQQSSASEKTELAKTPVVQGRSSGSGAYGIDSFDDATLYNIDGCAEENLRSFVRQISYVVYPSHGPITIPALVEWISSKGTSTPRLKKIRECVTRVKSLKAEEKLKRYCELHSAVVTLRRLQGNGGDPKASLGVRGESPLFIFLGGGMAAGKTTAVAALAKSSWWAGHKDQSVVVNADEFKVPQECELSEADAHTHSTRAAENLLVRAVNQGRSIVLDGTMMWAPFVEQVVAMIRHAHLTVFEQGPGYDKGANTETYFIAAKPRHTPLPFPYKIIFLGITVDVETAVPRGFVRKFSTGRGVPISMQLRSFRLFAANFSHYVTMMDETILYNNNVFVDLENGELPPIMAKCDKTTGNRLAVYDDAAYQSFQRQQTINEDADNAISIYPGSPVSMDRSSVLVQASP